jgi:hypothetical protein
MAVQTSLWLTIQLFRITTIGPFRKAQRLVGSATLRMERLDWIAPGRKICEAVQREIEPV